jgi:cellulose synthase/poly-beta-1,6-N-acetylglucosamine synthase-like glycosyltransferase
VSVHIPAYRENPRMLIETLDSVAALDYPNFEALVIVNNTPEEEYWRPIEAHCARLGERFKFVFLPKVDGFKAGALNKALEFMAPDAEVIALIDADYVVSPNWLKALVPAFANPKVGLVQAPQDHRDGSESAFKTVMNSEYAGFFDIGMVQRNEDDAIITHGTMLLIRRSAFEEVGGWSSDTITEDTELGLRILRKGYESVYTNHRYGYGMLPDTFQAYKMQRERWAYGAVQILRKHIGAMMPGGKELTAAQKFQFLTGWSFWISDSIGVIAAYLNLMWTPMILFVGVLIPTLPFTVPILAMFAVNVMHCALLYFMRVRLPFYQIAGAAVAAMSLQMTVAKAVLRGFRRNNKLAFNRTDKGNNTKSEKKVAAAPKKNPAWIEGWTGVALLAAAIALYVTNWLAMTEVYVFAATLAVQSLPFLAAPVMMALEHLAKRQPTAVRLGDQTAPSPLS